MLNFNFTDDAKTVTREDVLGSSAVDNAPPKQPDSFESGLFVLVDGTGLEQGGSALSSLQISLYRECSLLGGCDILGLVQQIGI